MEKAESERNLMESIISRKLSFFGHIIRKPTDCWKNKLSKVSHQEQEKSMRKATNNIKIWSGLSLVEVLRATDDRKHWKKIIHDEAKPRIVDC